MENGKRKYKSFTAPTKKEAEFLADQYLMDKDKIKKSIPDYSLGESIINYCDLKSNVLSPATIREYRRMKDNYYNSIQTVLYIKRIQRIYGDFKRYKTI